MRQWLAAARLRTLPLALSGLVLGACVAYSRSFFSAEIFAWTLLCTVLLQVLSNFANDYGDTQNGADSVERIGPSRAVQTGLISPKQMFRAILLMGILAFFSGIYLLYVSFGSINNPYFLGFLSLGLSCLAAAYFYTAGSKPYGYVGLGDLSVFLFFGFVAVLGTLFLFTKEIYSLDLLLGIGTGAMATAVLNINNIRDIKSDKAAGKITIPVRLGKKGAIFYHWILIIIAAISLLTFGFLNQAKVWFWLIGIILFFNARLVSKAENPDPYLKVMALSSLLCCLLLGTALI
jgi:1,4-dihydroxy-2-naphthoate polyprenyltransferase